METTNSKLLATDVQRIYLGNLKTVEADLVLPLKGENGSVFCWQSSHDYLLSPEGKVSRPHFGAGNREVTLTLTATNQDATLTKTFIANILEKEYPSTVVSAYPMTFYTMVGTLPSLPAVAIVRNNLQEDAVIPVEWPSISKEQVMQEGTFVVDGLVKDQVKVQATITVTKDMADLNPILALQKQTEKFPLSAVTLQPNNAFYNQQQRTLACLLAVNDDSMLYAFRQASGLSTQDAPPMTGWDAPECHLKGHTTGHYLSGLALCYSATKNAAIKQKLEYMIAQLAICQQAMEAQPEKFKKGFLSAYDETQFDLLEEYTTYPTIWAPYYTLHKIMAGLRDCYLYAENLQSFDLLKGIGLWVYNRLSALPKTQRDKMWAMYIAGEFGGINEVLADLYLLTQDDRYLQASKFFDNDKLYLPMKMDIDALGNLHANQHIPQIVGCMRQFDATGEKERFDIANNFWRFVTENHIYSIGGTGETEMFKPAGQIGKFISEKTAESCATYNMLKLTGQLFEYQPNSDFMDYYERGMTNHILSCGDIGGPTGGSTYFMGSNPGTQKEFNYTENSCCHGTGLENHFKYGEYVYTFTDNALYINLFVPSVLSTEKVQVTLDTKIEKDQFYITICPQQLAEKTLKVRKPYWAKKASISVNGVAHTPPQQDGYFIFDNIQGEITIAYTCVGYLSCCPDYPEIASICWGPYVLAALSENTEYIQLDTHETSIEQDVIHLSELHFEIKGYSFKPLHLIDQEHYHLYVKIRK